jgi:hypothetical protein
MANDASTISSAKYVSLVTVRRSGDKVASPVWIAALPDGRAGFTTDLDSGKVKRIRNNPSVTVQACSMRGALISGSPVVAATAEVVEGAPADAVQRAIRSKYWVVATLMSIPWAIKGLFGKKTPNSAIILTFGSTDAAAT